MLHPNLRVQIVPSAQREIQVFRYLFASVCLTYLRVTAGESGIHQANYAPSAESLLSILEKPIVVHAFRNILSARHRECSKLLDRLNSCVRDAESSDLVSIFSFFRQNVIIYLIYFLFVLLLGENQLIWQFIAILLIENRINFDSYL
jgi:hypothetical protein